MPEKKRKRNPIAEALEFAGKLQDLYEYVSHRDLVFVEIPSVHFLVPRMEREEVEDFAKTDLVRFYRGVHPLVLYIDNRIAVPVNSSLLQPYYTYLRYLVSTQPAVWAHRDAVEGRDATGGLWAGESGLKMARKVMVRKPTFQ